MLRRPSTRHHRLQEDKELQITSFLNLMVILIPFLLVTAVFSRLAVVELSLPTSAAQGPSAQPARLSLVLRLFPQSLEVKGDGKVLATIPGVWEGGYDVAALSKILRDLKTRYPASEGASLLSHGTIPYQTLIQVMDAARDAGFPEISVGEVRSP